MAAMTQPETPRTPTQRCAKKLGSPDLRNGMKVCNEPAEYVHQGGLTGWRHMDRTLDSDHYPVPAHWLS